jgi:DNA-directed RNA polymerase subunit RPC12/RpoP
MEQCGGKRCYRSEKEAIRIRNLREHNTSKLRVYQCPDCWYWHLTKQNNTDLKYRKIRKEKFE